MSAVIQVALAVGCWSYHEWDLSLPRHIVVHNGIFQDKAILQKYRLEHTLIQLTPFGRQPSSPQDEYSHYQFT